MRHCPKCSEPTPVCANNSYCNVHKAEQMRIWRSNKKQKQ